MQIKHILPAVFVGAAALFSSCEENIERYCFTVSEREVQVGARVKFNADCAEGIDQYHWNLGDGVDSVTSTPTVEYAFKTPGTYEVSLHSTTVETQDMCAPNAGANGARQTIEVK